MILFAAGDIGGARALLPVAREAAGRGIDFCLLEHGHIVKECPPSWLQTPPPQDLVPATVSGWLAALGASALVFASSVHDPLPLTLARHAKGLNLPVMHVLDNWTNYRRRLEHDGLPMLLPDIYAVMDETARAGALEEGLPTVRLVITGQPALASLAEETRRAASPAGWRWDGRLRLLFVSEPVAADQGTGPESPGFRGYTEQTVLRLLCQALQPHAGQVALSLLPHPRENGGALHETWQAARGNLDGEVLAPGQGREAVIAAEGVVGMASLLLYEAWLLGRPTLSLQPGVRSPALRMLAQREGVCFVEDGEKLAPALGPWLASLRPGCPAPRFDLARHQGAAARICDLLTELIKKGRKR